MVPRSLYRAYNRCRAHSYFRDRIDQLIYTPWLLAHYQKWWDMSREYSVNDIEFAVLFLRVCGYTSQFFPSQSYRLKTLNGVALADIREICTSVADILELVSNSQDHLHALAIARAQDFLFVPRQLSKLLDPSQITLKIRIADPECCRNARNLMNEAH